MKNNKAMFSTQMLVEAGIMVALSQVLGLFPLYQMPQGGDVSLSMLPIMVFAIRWGLAPGILVGVVYGVVSYIIKPYFYHPIQVLLDYPLPSAMIGIAGLSFSKDKNSYLGYIPSILIAYSLKFLMHFLSGLVFFPPETGSAVKYSFIYNITYIGPEIIIFLVVFALLWKPMGKYLRRQY